MADSIFALSSGQPPAAIGVIRISGPIAAFALEKLAGPLPEPRRASLRQLRNPSTEELLDEALLLWFPGPESATGEDLAEIHCHGGRAVVQAVEYTLDNIHGLRQAEPGEFTRRAFANGRIDLAQAEGLSDLLFAETEMQRRSAVRAAGGLLSQEVEKWQSEIMRLSAMVEAELDFSDEDDVVPAQADVLRSTAEDLCGNMTAVLDRPRAEKMREGVRVVLGGPPNSGKSTLLNALVEREAAIVSNIAGTTRDVLEIPVALDGIPFLFIDTAGLRDDGAEEIEKIGIKRAQAQLDTADIILWLGPEGEGPAKAPVIEIAARPDHPEFVPKSDGILSVSPKTGAGMEQLVKTLTERAKHIVPRADEMTVNRRQADHLAAAHDSLAQILDQQDYLIIAEQLRIARESLDSLTGKASTEDMLDALFGKFCIGK